MSDKVIEHRKFVCANADNNNNKFWEYALYEDMTVVIKYGRIGATCTTEPRKAITRSKLDSKIREKTKPGRAEGEYREIEVVAAPTGPSGPSAKVQNVKATAVRDIAKGDTVLEKLVHRLAEANRHELHVASGGQLDIDLTTGLVTTPIGIITQGNIDQARALLKGFVEPVQKQAFDTSDFKSKLNDYLMLVPQKVGHRGWHRTFISNDAALQRQSQLLDQLESSISLAEQRVKDTEKAAAKAAGKKVDDKVFEVELSVIDPSSAEFKRIVAFYEKGRNTMHTSHRLKPVRAYTVHIPSMRQEFDNDGAKLPNVWELWHGTRTHNVLSILKNKLIIPKSGGSIAITGRMFGDGLYFSDQSTKSLNYAYGYWDGGARDNNCFMFLAQVAMGNYYTPNRPLSNIPAGYDSCYAVGGQSGVMNNEMIVYRTSQADIRTLVEFSGD
jgi:poly [ADP-ribose] polymerase